VAEETISVVRVTQVAKEIGMGGNNPTQNVNVCGTDLGKEINVLWKRKC
jgi:hypothetical protein